MSKCKMCGEEIGNNLVCPFCGTPNTNNGAVQATATSGSQSILELVEEEKTRLVEQCGKSVVKVYKLNDKIAATGTGFVIKDNLIVTNAHVVEDEDENTPSFKEEIVVEFNSSLKLEKKIFGCNILYFSQREDIAILAPISGHFPSAVSALEIEQQESKQGELVFTIGNPLHYKFTYIEGSVANSNYTANAYYKDPILQTTLILNHGNSGGPVFNAKGKVVGMSTFSELNEDNSEIKGYGFCVKSQTILKALKNIRRR